MTPQRAEAGGKRAGWVRQGLAVVGAFAIGAALSGGVAFAVQSHSRPLHACANANGVLSLQTAHGSCPGHRSAVTIDQRGDRGARGARGAAGHRGRRGNQGLSGAHGPVTVSSIANGSTRMGSLAKGALDAVARSNLHVQAQCVAGVSSTIYILGADHYVVRGFSHFTLDDDATASENHQGSHGEHKSAEIRAGARLVAYQNGYNNDKSVSDLKVVAGADGQGEYSANLLAVDGKKTFTISVYLFVSNDPVVGCRATAQLTTAKATT